MELWNDAAGDVNLEGLTLDFHSLGSDAKILEYEACHRFGHGGCELQGSKKI